MVKLASIVDRLTLGYGTDRLSRNVGDSKSICDVMHQESEDLTELQCTLKGVDIQSCAA